MVTVLPCGGEGGDGPAVEGVVQGDDGAAAFAVLVKAILPGHLDHGLVGLGPGVAEEHLGQAGAGAQLPSQQGAGLGVEQVGDVSQLSNLGCDGGHPLLVAVAQGVHPDAAGEVDVLPPRQAVQGGPLPVVNVHREAPIGVHDVGVVQRLQFLKSHGIHSPSFFIFSRGQRRRLPALARAGTHCNPFFDRLRRPKNSSHPESAWQSQARVGMPSPKFQSPAKRV